MESATNIIRADHDRIRSHIEAYDETSDRERGQSYVEDLFIALEEHAMLEERVFYPWVLEQGLGESWVDIAREEHALAATLMRELAMIDAGDPRFGAKLLLLRENLDRHIEHQQDQVLAFADSAPREALDKLSERLDGERASAHDTAAQHFRDAKAARVDVTGGHPSEVYTHGRESSDTDPMAALTEDKMNERTTGDGRRARATSTGDGLTTDDLEAMTLTPREQEVVEHVSGGFNGLHLETSIVHVKSLEGGTVSTLRFTLGGAASADLHRSEIAGSEDVEAMAHRIIEELRSQLPGAPASADETPEKANQLAHDPVCHMDIGIDDAFGRSDYEGRSYYFCSESCQKQFEADPAGVLQREASAHPVGATRP